jgi:hypothetical protein
MIINHFSAAAIAADAAAIRNLIDRYRCAVLMASENATH